MPVQLQLAEALAEALISRRSTNYNALGHPDRDCLSGKYQLQSNVAKKGKYPTIQKSNTVRETRLEKVN